MINSNVWASPSFVVNVSQADVFCNIIQQLNYFQIYYLIYCLSPGQGNTHLFQALDELDYPIPISETSAADSSQKYCELVKSSTSSYLLDHKGYKKSIAWEASQVYTPHLWKHISDVWHPWRCHLTWPCPAWRISKDRLLWLWQLEVGQAIEQFHLKIKNILQ